MIVIAEPMATKTALCNLVPIRVQISVPDLPTPSSHTYEPGWMNFDFHWKFLETLSEEPAFKLDLFAIFDGVEEPFLAEIHDTVINWHSEIKDQAVIDRAFKRLDKYSYREHFDHDPPMRMKTEAETKEPA